MNKNTLLVLVIILVPIVIAGTVAVMGASKLGEKEGAESSSQPSTEGNESTGLGAVIDVGAIHTALVPVEHQAMASTMRAW